MSLVDSTNATVSRRAYWDPDVYRAEQERIFRTCWLFVAHESEIATNGDYVTRRMGHDSVIVTRDDAGAIQVFLNSCLHRGTQLCRSDLGNTSHFRCSYHGWTYKNSGELRGVPEAPSVYGAGFDRGKYRLVAPRVDTFQGLVFATWNPGAEPLSDYLGDIGWYLETVLGATADGLEVVGPPGRTVVRTNWKIGAENYAGDGYHLDTTHKTPIDLGVFGTQHELAQLGKPSSKKTFAHNVHGGNGHGVRVQQLPIEFERPTFLGYPPEFWPEFERNLTPQQVEVKSGMAVVHGNVFPNLSFLESVVVSVGDDTPPTSFVHLRQWQPVSPDTTEMLLWCLVPAAASPEFKLNAQRVFVRTLGIGGIFETDDFQNWTSIAAVNRGPVAWDQDFDYTAGAQVPPGSDVSWPGQVWQLDHTEVNQSAMYRRWAQLMAEPGPAAQHDGGAK